MSLPHKPLHNGDFDDDLLNLVVKMYNDDELREDNYNEVAMKLNDYMSMRKNDKKFVDSTKYILKAVSSLNINEEKKDD